MSRYLLFLTFLFIPTQLGKHFWPRFSHIFSLKIDYLSPTIYFWDLLVLVLLLSALLKKIKINQTALSIFLIFILSQFISLLWAANPGAGIVRLELYVVSGLFGVYIASLSLSKFQTPLKTALSVALVFEGLLALSQFLLGRSIGFWVLGERSFDLSTPTIANFNWFGQILLRPYGTFSHPNVLAAFAIISLPLLLFLYNKKLPWFLFTIAILTTIITFSRSAITLLLLQSFLFFRNRAKLFGVVLIMAAPFLVIRFGSAINYDNLSLIRREELAESAIKIFYQNPIVGIGLNNFIPNVAVSELIAGPNRFLQPVHNIFLLVLSETGVVGFAGFMLLFAAPIVLLWKRRMFYYSKLLLFCWLIIVSLGMFDHYLITLPQGIRLLFLVWGLSFLQEHKNGDVVTLSKTR